MQGPLPAPTASGSFIKTPFPHLMVYALERRLTGTFELSRGSISMATILVMGGCPSKIRTSDPVHFLGNVLLELGMITPAHLQASVAQAGPGRLQGQILLQMNAIDAARLDAGLRSQVERKVEHLFGLSTDCTFAYYDNVDLLQQYGGPPTPIDPFPVLWRGCREQPALEHVDATFRRVGTALLRAAPNAQLERFAFTPQEREAVDMLRHRPTRAVDIAGALGQRVGQTLVYFLMIMKQVDLIDATQPMAPVGPPIAPPAPSSSRQIPAASPASQQQIARVQLQRQAAPTRGPLVVEEQVAVPSRDDRAAPPSGAPPGGAFGGGQGAFSAPPPSGGGGAFGGSAFSPPTPAQPIYPVQPPPPMVQQPPTPPAQQVISAPAAPAGGMMDIGSMIVATIQQSNAPPAIPAAAAPSTPSVPVAAKVPQISDPPPDNGPASGKVLTAEQSSLKTKILERAETITSQDYFQMLGLDREASTDQIQRAFIGLAKVWHPDRLPPALIDVKDACSKVFTYLTEANATLSDPSKRQDYLKLLKEGGASPEDQQQIQAILEAATEFQKVEFLLKRNPTDPQAHEMVKRCVMLDNEQPDYLATLAWLDAQKPEWLSREKTLEKTLILDRCIVKNPMCERAFFYRGMLYKRAEEYGKALKDFKKAAELNPRNLDAMREVRLHNMRGGSKQGTNASPTPGRPSASPPAQTSGEKLGGLFGKLFKK